MLVVWATSRRKERFNKGWEATRLRILRRDGWVCQWPVIDPVTGVSCKCGVRAVEVDHKRRALNGVDDDSPSNLWALCHAHHAYKTGVESADARRVKRERRKEAAWYSHPAFG